MATANRKKEQKIAELLHLVLCTQDHTDQCSWYYQKTWDDNYSEYSPRALYLKKAQRMLKVTDNDLLIEDLINCIKG